MAHPSLVINSVTYSEVPEIDVPKSGGGTAKYYDTSECDVAAADVLVGKKFTGASGSDVGTMANNGDISSEIETKSGSVTVSPGYTSGGTVSIKSSAVSDCLAGNILSGKTILGVSGSLVMPSISQDSTTKILSIS